MVEFICIGAQKAGTTWLHGRIRHHPDVWTCPAGKEIHYFDMLYCDYNPTFFATLKSRIAGQLVKLRANTKRQNEIETIEKMEFLSSTAAVLDDTWYSTLYSLGLNKKPKIKGDITPNYCTLPSEGIEHVRNLIPNTRIIYMIRDPLDRAISALRMMTEWHNDDVGLVLSDPTFAARGDYQGNIQRWERAFEQDQILYVPFGNIRKEPQETLSAVEAHIGLKPWDGYPELAKEVNSSKSRNDIITEDVLARLKNMVAPQYDFLQNRFGTEFMQNVK